MRFITTKTHGYLDYFMGILLIVAPFILNFDRGGAETYVPVILGAGTIVYSLMTDYELGMFHWLPMGAHLTLDLLGGIFLAVSPWLFGFAGYIWAPHVVLGVIEIGASLFTNRVAGTDRSHHHHRNHRHAVSH
jgi:hypothetical protein